MNISNNEERQKANDMLIQMAQQIAKSQGHDVTTVVPTNGERKGQVTWASPAARQAVIALLQDAVLTMQNGKPY